MIVLVGFMGAGKTTVGRLLAERVNLPFIDTDELVEQAAGKTIGTIFREGGEASFRTMEREAVERALQGPDAVVAVGGGAVHDPVTCSLLSWHAVVHLDVSYPEAMRRIGHDAGRPMLHLSDPRALYDDRRQIYARVASHVVDTTSVSPDRVVASIIRATGVGVQGGPAKVTVELGPRSYPILIGENIAPDAPSFVDMPAADRAFLVTHPSLAAHAKPLLDSLVVAGFEVDVLTIDEGESSKNLDVAGRLLQEMADRGAHRSDLVVGFGGGVVCDLAGFIASVYHRGMPVLHVPTTLLAQVDAAIGGKTAVNLPQGKNLIGTIHQPLAVICDVSLLRSLPVEEVRSALAEVVKYGFISDPDLLGVVSEEIDPLLACEPDVLQSVVRRSCAIKARVVAMDETEAGHREILNYGHTFGHAIEHETGTRHGEAISVGMMAAAHLAHDLGMLDAQGVEMHADVLGKAGLPLAREFDTARVLGTLKRDKKHRGGTRFVLLAGIGSPRVGVEATDAQIEDALRKVVP
ncbi:MAG TPA: 3-dehydroquinate synthase [Actinomycetota bacterium]|nr:3-dehydroquinate synthase [Actinomycetota bacterium]